MDKKPEEHYLKQAEEIIDNLFDNGYFAIELKRQDLRKLEELIAFYLQSAAESAVKVDKLVRKIHNKED